MRRHLEPEPLIPKGDTFITKKNHVRDWIDGCDTQRYQCLKTNRPINTRVGRSYLETTHGTGISRMQNSNDSVHAPPDEGTGAVSARPYAHNTHRYTKGRFRYTDSYLAFRPFLPPSYQSPLPEAPASAHCSVAGLSTSRGHSVHLLSSEHTSATTARGSCSATWAQRVQNI